MGLINLDAFDAICDEDDAPRGRLPTPEEIRAECERIQATWTEAERAQRLGLSLAALDGMSLTAPQVMPLYEGGSLVGFSSVG